MSNSIQKVLQNAEPVLEILEECILKYCSLQNKIMKIIMMNILKQNIWYVNNFQLNK